MNTHNNNALTLKILDSTPYCLLAWNVNGYSDAIHEWTKTLLQERNPDILFLSETKRRSELLNECFAELKNYNCIVNAHVPPHYHGVVMLIRKDRTYQQLDVNLSIPARKDTKNGNPTTGRVIAIQLDGHTNVVGAYVPNSGVGRKDYTDKLNYRLHTWDSAFSSFLNTCKSQAPTIWLGDINVARYEIDVSAPKWMCKVAGFTPEERKNFENFLATGWVDVWRTQHPAERSYSWRGKDFKKDYGMRLDNILVSPELFIYTHNSFMLTDCMFSDHIPVGIEIYLYGRKGQNKSII